MRSLKSVLLAATIIYGMLGIICYMVFSFFFVSFNVATWYEGGRFIFATIILFLCFLWLISVEKYLKD